MLPPNQPADRVTLPPGTPPPRDAAAGSFFVAYRKRPDNWPMLKWHEYLRIRDSFDFFDIPEDARQEIIECLHSTRWDWYEDCDGCTCVSEPGWPSKYYPPCVRHDYDWFTGGGGWVSNARFLRLNQLYHMEGWRARARWVGVTVAWYGFYKWWKML